MYDIVMINKEKTLKTKLSALIFNSLYTLCCLFLFTTVQKHKIIFVLCNKKVWVILCEN